LVETFKNFQENSDGTVTDSEEDLQWPIKDSRKELGKWLNWDEANAYVTACNEQKYLGHDDWRLPTKSEVRSLLRSEQAYRVIFLKQKTKKPARSVANYQAGGETSFWTNETRFDSYAWKCYFPGAREICVEQSVSTTGSSVRLVRDV
jgi:hypothetical protein